MVEVELSESQRRLRLDRMVERYVEHGYTVESNTGWQAVVSKRQDLRRLLNVAMVLVTGGFWLIVLLIRAMNWPKDRVVLRVNEYGDLTASFSS